MQTDAEDFNQMAMVKPTDTVPMNVTGEHMVQMQNTIAGSPDDPSTVLNMQTAAEDFNQMAIEKPTDIQMQTAAEDFNQMAIVKPTDTVPLKITGEHMVQMQNTIAGSPDDPSTVLNVSSKQILTKLNADPMTNLQSNLNEHKATNSQYNLNIPGMVQMQTGEDADVSIKISDKKSHITEQIPEQQTHHAKVTAEVTELHSKMNTDNVRSKLNFHSEHKVPKQTFAAAEDFNQKAIVKPYDTVRVASKQNAEKMVRKAVSPNSNNKKQTAGNRPVLPSTSNSFDVLNNVNDDESQNSEAKRASHANDTKLKSIIAPIVPKRAKSSKSKTWKNQRDYDDEETWGEGLASFSWEEEDLGSEEDSDDSVTQEIQKENSSKNCRANLKQTANSNRRLNHNAPVYVPRNNTNANSSIEGTSKFNNNATIHNRQLNTDVISVDDRTTTLQASNSHNKEQQYILDVDTVAFSQTKQLVTTDSAISAEQRQNLEVMVNSETVMTTKGDCPELPILSIAGKHLYEEGEEEDYINQCRADVSIKGDLSPMHSARIKKSHQRERSWDGNWWK